MCFSNDTDAFLKAEVVTGGRRGSLRTRIYYSHLHVFFKLWGDVTSSFLDPTSWEIGNVTVS